MVRRRFVQLEPQEAPHAQRIGRSPRDPALRVEPFEVPEQQQAEIATRGQARTPQLVGVESLTERLDVPIEVHFVEDLVQSPIERMRGTPRQVLCGHPHRRLRRATSSFAHCHARQCSTRDRSCRSFSMTFTTGC